MKNEFDAYARIRELAAMRGMTVSALAKTCGINPSTLSNVKTRGGQPTLETISKVCDGLDITLVEFFALTDPVRKSPKRKAPWAELKDASTTIDAFDQLFGDWESGKVSEPEFRDSFNHLMKKYRQNTNLH